MCDVARCQNESVAFVDIDFPETATLAADIDSTRAYPVQPQRVGFCPIHAGEQGLTQAITKARASKAAKTKLPAPGHALAEWGWTRG